MKIYRAALLRFDQDGQALYEPDGLLAVDFDAASGSSRERIVAVGSWQALSGQWAHIPGAELIHLPGRILAPGFVDLHIHYPQTDDIGAPADGLLPWLERAVAAVGQPAASSANANPGQVASGG